MSTKAELACVYAALVLVDDDIAVTVSTNSLIGYKCAKIIIRI